ncbi:Rieske 2Fe-2S domain-containing protein [Paeniglutamicibacter sp.]|uniref:Rieske 2Fe-2S domain-containing protein n=1 Tax=Paeniglutamicibacter sp. TaxID=1934391 RepID=UPI003989C944
MRKACTHQDASLAEGRVEGCEVHRPLHTSTFDLRTMEASGTPAPGWTIRVRPHCHRRLRSHHD